MTLRPLIAYVPWQLRDIFPRALVPLVLFAVFGGIPVAVTLRGVGNAAPPDPEAFGAMLRMIYIGVVPLCFTLGAFLFMTRSIAEDRERSYVRFLFAHPVAPEHFYLSRFVVGLLTFAACFLPVPLVLRAYGADVPVLGSLVAMASVFALVGGLTTLCAAFANKDGLALIIVYVVTQSLQRLATQDVLPAWAEPIVRGLPPIDSLNLVMKSLLEATDWPVTDIIHVVGYGLGLLAAGLFVLRRSPLVR